MARCISCSYSVARPGGVRVLLWVSICHPSPSSVHNNLPKGSDPASSLQPRAGAGDAEFCLYQKPRESGPPWCSMLAKFRVCRAVWPRPHSVLGATSSPPGAKASVHLLHGDLRGGSDSEVELPVKWEQHFGKEKPLVSFVSWGVWLNWCGLPSRRCWAL